MPSKKWLEGRQHKKVLKFIGRRSLLYLVLGVFTGIALFVAEIAFAYILQAFLMVLGIMPAGTVQVPAWIPTNTTSVFLAFVVGALIFKGLAQWFHSYLTAASSEIQRDHQRFRLVEWSLRAPSVSSGILLDLFNEATTATSLVLSNIQSIVIFLSTSVLIWLFLLRMSPWTTLIATMGILAIGLFIRFLDPPIREEGRRVIEKLEQVNMRLTSSIKNLLLVQIYGTQVKERKEIKARLDSVLAGVLRYDRVLYLKFVIPQTLGMILICGLSLVATREGWLASQMAVTYFYLFLRFVQGFAESVRLSSTVLFYLPNTVRLATWWADNSHDGIRNPVALKFDSARREIENPIGWKLSGVRFGHIAGARPLLDGFDLTIAPGRATVIVGESGSGKSTLLSILIGNLKPQAGRVEVFTKATAPAELGEELQATMLQSIGYVGPECFLIEGTVRENVTYGLEQKFTPAELDAALAKADCSFISQLPKGLDHRITEQGTGLSAGQKQRLSLARALLRKPQALILDEATANLDSKTEERLVETLRSLKGQSTLVIVTHREAPLSLADEVVRL